MFNSGRTCQTPSVPESSKTRMEEGVCPGFVRLVTPLNNMICLPTLRRTVIEL